ncbi:MAG: hypothetical protein NVS3B20_06890 [Polyangiales bacterium]
MHPRPKDVPTAGAIDDALTPVLATGILAGIGGGILGFFVAGVGALAYGHGFLEPPRLVAASLMGSEALMRNNETPAALLGLLIILVGAGILGVFFTWMRRREYRLRWLLLEGVGFALVMFTLLHLLLPYVDPTMAKHQPWPPLLLSFIVFGASLTAQLPLRVGKMTGDVDVVRASLGSV